MSEEVDIKTINEEFAKKLYLLFDIFHENLVTTRNFACTFGNICINKISEYQPNAELQKELTNYLRTYIKEKIQNDDGISDEEMKIEITNTFELLLKKHKLTLKEFDKKTKEKIANGTKLGIELNTLSDKLSFYRNSQKQIYKNALENLVVYFKDFLSSALKVFYLKNISALNSKTIKFELINNAASIDEAKEIFVRSEIEELFHKSISDIFSIIYKELKIKLPFLDKHKKEVLELFYRRNICVHNKCIVNKTYLELSGNPYNLKEGMEIQNSEDYLYNASSLLLLLGAEFVTIIVNKNKFTKKDYDEEINKMSAIAFEHYLKREDWDFAQEFYEILSENTHLSTLSKDLYRLNILLCKKKTNQITLANIKRQKWESTREFLQLGILALLEDYNSLSNLLIKNCDNDEGVDVEALNTWPIFKDYRQTNLFSSTVKSINQKLHKSIDN